MMNEKTKTNENSKEANDLAYKLSIAIYLLKTGCNVDEVKEDLIKYLNSNSEVS